MRRDHAAAGSASPHVGRREWVQECDDSAVATTLCIVGDSRSGSTLLQGLIELHPDAIAVGELRRLQSFIAERGLCSCGLPVAHCPCWLEALDRAGLTLAETRTQRPTLRLTQRFEEAVGFAGTALGVTAFTRLLLPCGRVVASHASRILTAVAAGAQAKVVVDNSKDPGHAVYLLHQKEVPIHVVFITRDGRGVVWSKMRRTGMSAERATRHWALTMRSMLALSRVLGPDRCSWVRYEDLCADPRAVLGRLGSRVGLAPNSWGKASRRTHHRIGGSPDYAGVSLDLVREDRRWQTEMPEDAQTVFERLSGSLGRRLARASELPLPADAPISGHSFGSEPKR